MAFLKLTLSTKDFSREISYIESGNFYGFLFLLETQWKLSHNGKTVYEIYKNSDDKNDLYTILTGREFLDDELVEDFFLGSIYKLQCILEVLLTKTTSPSFKGWVLTQGSPNSSFITNTIKNSLLEGDLTILKEAKRLGIIPVIEHRLLSHCTNAGKFESVMFILDNERTEKEYTHTSVFFKNLIEKAIVEGRVDVVEWCKQKRCPMKRSYSELAEQHDRYDILEILKRRVRK